MLCFSALLIPMWWSVQTVLMDNPNSGLPSAYAGEEEALQLPPNDRSEDPRQKALINYLEENTQNTKYLLAVPSAQIGARFILETGRPVLYMGGFNGNDPVVDAEDLQELVDMNELKYVFYQDLSQERDKGVREWLRSSCHIIKEFSKEPQDVPNHTGPPNQNKPVLFECS
jgi:4-amino-4-deoxy-L-arabinose transferase-like glycosyltransferase